MNRFGLLAAAFALALAWAAPAHAAARYLDEVFPNVTVTSNIAYGQSIDEFGQPETLRLDLYQPTGDTLTERPVLIFVHGGGFTGGDKANASGVDFATAFAKRGYVTASINYRLRENGFPPSEQLQVIVDAQYDAQAAVRWFRANEATYGIDTERISISGYSAGAATALFATYNTGFVGDSGNPGYPSNVSAVVEVSGGMLLSLMESGEPPVLIVHGTADATVPYSSALDILARAQEVGVSHELLTLQGAQHSKFSDFQSQIIAEASTFLYERVIVAGEPVGGVAELAAVELTPAREGAAHLGLRAALVAGAAAAAVASGIWLVRRRRSRR